MISLEEAISSSERRAKQFWLISILWVLIMLVVASAFGASIYQFDKTRREIDQLTATVTEQQKRANELIEELERTKGELSGLKTRSSAD